MIKTKYIKVQVSERLPEKEGSYIVYHSGFRCNLFTRFDPAYLDYFRDNIEYWLDEVPDREQEMKEMLEFIYGYGETVDWSKVRPKLEELLNSIK